VRELIKNRRIDEEAFVHDSHSIAADRRRGYSSLPRVPFVLKSIMGLVRDHASPSVHDKANVSSSGLSARACYPSARPLDRKARDVSSRSGCSLRLCGNEAELSFRLVNSARSEGHVPLIAMKSWIFRDEMI